MGPLNYIDEDAELFDIDGTDHDLLAEMYRLRQSAMNLCPLNNYTMQEFITYIKELLQNPAIHVWVCRNTDATISYYATTIQHQLMLQVAAVQNTLLDPLNSFPSILDDFTKVGKMMGCYILSFHISKQAPQKIHALMDKILVRVEKNKFHSEDYLEYEVKI